jgi:hypothetical protein
MTQLGLTVAPKIQHLVVVAGMVSFLIAGIRNRNASSVIPNPTPVAPAEPVKEEPKA